KYVFSVYLPSEEEHRNHLLGQISTFHLPIDKRIIKKIKDLALEESDRRFYPTNKDIRTHIYQTVVGSNLCSSEDDQANTKAFLEKFQASCVEDKYFFRPASSDGDVSASLLLVYQSKFQKKF
ncbi:hypothetical protein ScPMuIL_003488, partial [Solemya velum]